MWTSIFNAFSTSKPEIIILKVLDLIVAFVFFDCFPLMSV